MGRDQPDQCTRGSGVASDSRFGNRRVCRGCGCDGHEGAGFRVVSRGAHLACQAEPERRMNSLEVRSLTKVFGGLHAVQNASFNVRKGTVHSVIGPNGAGKTTLINLITGMYTPTSGQVLFESQDIT